MDDPTTIYRYSGDGLLAIERKYENTALTQETRFVRDGGLVMQERNGSNGVTREYTWGLNLGGGIGGLLNLKQSGQNYAYLYDGSGNVEAVLNSAQAVVAVYRYDPFGNLEAKTGTLQQPYGFSTKRYDEQLGMLFYEARPYHPAIVKWMTRDPLGEEGGLNLYAFVGNNPVNWVDPWGLAPLINNSGQNILYKPEHGTCLKVCLDASTCNADGIYPNNSQYYPVIKLPDNSIAIAKPDGKVDVIVILPQIVGPLFKKYPYPQTLPPDFFPKNPDWPIPDGNPERECK